MNCSVHVFGKLLQDFVQYPYDCSRTVFQEAADNITSNKVIVIRRLGNIVYYVYMRKVAAVQAELQYAGFSVEFNDVYCCDFPAIWAALDDSFARLVLWGNLLNINDGGELVVTGSSLSLDNPDVMRILDSLRFTMEHLEVSSFKKMPPLNYSVDGNECVRLSYDAEPQEIDSAFGMYSTVFVGKPDRMDALDSCSARIRNLSERIGMLASRKNELETELVKVRRQKKRTAMVTALSVTIMLIVLVFISVGTNLSDQVRSLTDDNAEMKGTIGAQESAIADYKEQIDRYASENRELKRSIRQMSGELDEVKKEKCAFQSKNKKLEEQVSSLSSRNELLTSQIAVLKIQLNANAMTTSPKNVLAGQSCSHNHN